MKTLIILFSLLINPIIHEEKMNEIRELYSVAYLSNERCDMLGKAVNKKDINDSYLINGYRGCYYLIKCKFIKNPITRLKYFRRGKNLLEVAIMENNKSVELRFLRYSIQTNLPKYLLYNKEIKKDITFVKLNIDKISNKFEKEYIKFSIKSLDK